MERRSLFQAFVIGFFLFSYSTFSFAINPNCEPPNLMLVMDVSGSMHDENKIDGLKTALKKVILGYQGKINFGLIIFSGKQVALKVQIGPLSTKQTAAHTKKLLDAVAGLAAFGDTPMLSAFKLAHSNYITFIPTDKIHQIADPTVKRQMAVLFMTDGETTDGSPVPFIDKLRKLKIGKKLYDIKTYVVGFGSSRNIRSAELQKFAKHGGTKNFYHAQSASQLAEAFKRVSGSVSQKEICNGKDDDCDGIVDEDLKRECKSACSIGKQICHKGKWSKCDAPPPKTEVCDGLDNNCNGKVDEGLRRPCSTDCGKGFQGCIRGDWSSCDAPQPQKEICNGKDDDCDGKIDMTACPGGKCVEAGSGNYTCDIPCQDGECPKNFQCNNKTDKCIERPCFKHECLPGEVCDDSKGSASCKNLCVGVQCPDGKTCGEKGTCINCYEGTCPPKMLCYEGRCIVDKCSGVQCSQTQSCRDGKCYDTCNCTKDQTCTKGNCLTDPCAQVKCKAGEVCIEGSCLANKCRAGIDNCGSKLYCNPITGDCADNPCARTKCPKKTKCFKGECFAEGKKPSLPKGQCIDDKDCASGASCQSNYCKTKKDPGPITAGGGEGCGCISSGRDTHIDLSALMLCLLFFLGIRRRFRPKRNNKR